MNHPWRCMACASQTDPLLFYGRNFEAEQPRCPECGATKPVVIGLVRVHFMVMSDDGPIQGHHHKRQFVACKPSLKTFGEHVVATGDPNAVTCPECKRHREFKEEYEAAQATVGGVMLSPSSRPLEPDPEPKPKAAPKFNEQSA